MPFGENFSNLSVDVQDYYNRLSPPEQNNLKSKFEASYLELKAGNVLEVKDEFGQVLTGTWSLSGSTLKTQITGQNLKERNIAQYSTGKMTLKSVEGYELIFLKQ